MPRKSDAKERLMSAALDLIWGQSYGATSVDAICQKAGVQKGSFYHFFESKSDLAVAALDADWLTRRPTMDRIFSSATPPLERLTNYFDHVAQSQTAIHSECGSILGCPLFSLGSEICTQDAAIGHKVREILDSYVKYFESAIRDAHAQGALNAPNATTKAKLLFAFFQGTLTQARIQNDVTYLRELKAGALELLGALPEKAIPA
jgi:TetR/AcrR family transcriptional repressor of nem operon